MYDKVQKHWKREHRRAAGASWTPPMDEERHELEATHRLHGRDRHGGGRLPGAERDRRDGREGAGHPARTASAWSTRTWTTKFKDPDDPFRLVFVCAMWMTGFDVPSCSTLYLDKPMRNHTLMQTIARANRVFPGQGQRPDRGLCRGVPRPAAGAGHLRRRAGGGEGDNPVEDKAALVGGLRAGHRARRRSFCQEHGVEPRRPSRRPRASTASGCSTMPWTRWSSPTRSSAAILDLANDRATGSSRPSCPIRRRQEFGRRGHAVLGHRRQDPRPDPAGGHLEVMEQVEDLLDRLHRRRGLRHPRADDVWRRPLDRSEQDRLRGAGREVRARAASAPKREAQGRGGAEAASAWCGSTAPGWTIWRSSRR